MLSWLAVGFTFIWVAWLLRNGINNILTGSSRPTLSLGSLAFVNVVLSMLIGARAFEAIMLSTGAIFTSFWSFSELYFTGMLMRHLPGRIFGVIYQSKKGNDHASPSQWIAGNVAFTLLSTWLAVALALLALCIFRIGSRTAFFGLGLIILAPLLLILTKEYLNKVSVKSDRILRIMETLQQTLQGLFNRYGLAALGWALLSWLPYTIAWGLLGESFPTLGWQAGIQLGALYTLAWAVGYLSLITPGGLGVRELVFVLLTTQFPSELIAYIAVIARVALLLSDMILGSFFICSQGIRKKFIKCDTP